MNVWFKSTTRLFVQSFSLKFSETQVKENQEKDFLGLCYYLDSILEGLHSLFQPFYFKP